MGIELNMIDIKAKDIADVGSKIESTARGVERARGQNMYLINETKLSEAMQKTLRVVSNKIHQTFPGDAHKEKRSEYIKKFNDLLAQKQILGQIRALKDKTKAQIEQFELRFEEAMQRLQTQFVSTIAMIDKGGQGSVDKNMHSKKSKDKKQNTIQEKVQEGSFSQFDRGAFLQRMLKKGVITEHNRVMMDALPQVQQSLKQLQKALQAVPNPALNKGQYSIATQTEMEMYQKKTAPIREAMKKMTALRDDALHNVARCDEYWWNTLRYDMKAWEHFKKESGGVIKSPITGVNLKMTDRFSSYADATERFWENPDNVVNALKFAGMIVAMAGATVVTATLVIGSSPVTVPVAALALLTEAGLMTAGIKVTDALAEGAGSTMRGKDFSEGYQKGITYDAWSSLGKEYLTNLAMLGVFKGIGKGVELASKFEAVQKITPKDAQQVITRIRDSFSHSPSIQKNASDILLKYEKNPQSVALQQELMTLLTKIKHDPLSKDILKNQAKSVAKSAEKSIATADEVLDGFTKLNLKGGQNVLRSLSSSFAKEDVAVLWKGLNLQQKQFFYGLVAEYLGFVAFDSTMLASGKLWNGEPLPTAEEYLGVTVHSAGALIGLKFGSKLLLEWPGALLKAMKSASFAKLPSADQTMIKERLHELQSSMTDAIKSQSSDKLNAVARQCASLTEAISTKNMALVTAGGGAHRVDKAPVRSEVSQKKPTTGREKSKETTRTIEQWKQEIAKEVTTTPDGKIKFSKQLQETIAQIPDTPAGKKERLSVADFLLRTYAGSTRAYEKSAVILKAHDLPGSVGAISKGQAMAKGRVLMKDGGMTRKEAEVLLDSGVCGRVSVKQAKEGRAEKNNTKEHNNVSEGYEVLEPGKVREFESDKYNINTLKLKIGDSKEVTFHAERTSDGSIDYLTLNLYRVDASNGRRLSSDKMLKLGESVTLPLSSRNLDKRVKITLGKYGEVKFESNGEGFQIKTPKEKEKKVEEPIVDEQLGVVDLAQDAIDGDGIGYGIVMLFEKVLKWWNNGKKKKKSQSEETHNKDNGEEGEGSTESPKEARIGEKKEADTEGTKNELTPKEEAKIREVGDKLAAKQEEIQKMQEKYDEVKAKMPTEKEIAEAKQKGAFEKIAQLILEDGKSFLYHFKQTTWKLMDKRASQMKEAKNNDEYSQIEREYENDQLAFFRQVLQDNLKNPLPDNLPKEVETVFRVSKVNAEKAYYRKKIKQSQKEYTDIEKDVVSSPLYKKVVKMASAAGLAVTVGAGINSYQSHNAEEDQSSKDWGSSAGTPDNRTSEQVKEDLWKSTLIARKEKLVATDKKDILELQNTIYALAPLNNTVISVAYSKLEEIYQSSLFPPSVKEQLGSWWDQLSTTINTLKKNPQSQDLRDGVLSLILQITNHIHKSVNNMPRVAWFDNQIQSIIVPSVKSNGSNALILAENIWRHRVNAQNNNNALKDYTLK